MHCILLLRESQKRRLEPNILTLCSAAVCRTVAFAFPAFFASGCAFAPKASFPTFTVPFLRRGFSPHSSVLRTKKRKAVFRNMLIFTCKLIMNLLSDFVNRFTQIWQKRKQRRFLPVLKTMLLHKKDPKQCFGSFLVSHRGFEPRAP